MRRFPALGFEASLAFGVGQSRAILSSPASRRLSPPRERKLSVCGVGHSRRISERLPPLDRRPEQARGVGQCVSFPAGKDEEAFAAVRSADFRRSKETRRKSVAHADQVFGDFGKSESQMMRDVFQKDEGRLAIADDAGDVRPEMSGIVGAAALAGDGERLARIARKDDVHAAAPASAVKGGNIVPDRRLIQGRVFHPRHEHGCGVGFPLDVTHSPIVVDGKMQGEVEAACAGAERESEHSVVAGCIVSGGT